MFKVYAIFIQLIYSVDHFLLSFTNEYYLVDLLNNNNIRNFVNPFSTDDEEIRPHGASNFWKTQDKRFLSKSQRLDAFESHDVWNTNKIEIL